MSIWNWWEIPRPIIEAMISPNQLTSGVNQDCLLSPTLFNLFINGLIEELKKLGLVKFDELILALLMFADGIALMAETEQDLQCMLNVLHSWCKCWLQ